MQNRHHHSSFHPEFEFEFDEPLSFRGLISSSKFRADKILKKVSNLVESGESSKLETVSCRIPTLLATLL